MTEFLTNRRIELVLTPQLITELHEVTSRKKFKKYFKPSKVSELLKLMDILGTEYQVVEYPEICRDPKDDFLLGLIKIAKPNFLVTGDKDLLELNPFEGTEIIEAIELRKRITDRQ